MSTHILFSCHPFRTTTALGLATLGALLLSGCLSAQTEPDGSEQTTTTAASPEQTASPEQSPAESAAALSRSPSASDRPSRQEGSEALSASDETLSADQLTEILLSAEDLPATIMQDRTDHVSEGPSFSMSLTLSGVEPQGECAQAVEEVNDFEVALTKGVSGDYELMDELQGAVRAPSLQIIAAVTEEPVDAMALYGALAQACPTVESANEGGAVASMTRIGDLDAVQILFEVGPEGSRQAMDSLAIGGDSVGRHHIYLAASRLPEQETEEIFLAQVERFHQALERQGIPVED